jgi:hypothetical protein
VAETESLRLDLVVAIKDQELPLNGSQTTWGTELVEDWR